MISVNATNRSNCLENGTTDQDIGSETEIYLKSTMRFSMYTTIRGLEVVIGIIGNILTLIIINKLRNRSNVHILMIYLAVSDILVSTIYPLDVYVFASDRIFARKPYWKHVCITKEFLISFPTASCVLSYMLLSLDRYDIFSLFLQFR